ncbi:MAG: hypothetical protein AAGF95_31390 [Chloroflexota bacterium]
MHRQNGNGRVIGLNIHGVDWDLDDTGKELPPKPTQLSEAINIKTFAQASWNTGLHFDTDSRGTRAILIEGDWNVGLDMGEHNIRMEAGSKIFLEGTSMISILWNAEKARIEFRFGDKVLGYLSHDSPEHAL